MTLLLPYAKRTSQALIFIAIWLLAQGLVSHAHLPVPASILGLACVLTLLFGRVLPTRYLEAGAELLLGDMVLFFIPPLLSVISLWPLLSSQGGRLALALVTGCLSVMICTAMVVERVFRYEQSRNQLKGANNE